MELDPRNVAWTARLFRAMVNGAKWGVPRSGLFFTRKEGKLILTEIMPYTPEMAMAKDAGRDAPASEADLQKYQLSDFNLIASHFRAAGIEVEDQTNLTKTQPEPERKK